MQICAEKVPPTVGSDAHHAECWLLQPADDESRRPLTREKVSVADEA